MIAELVAASRPLSWINTAFPFAAAYLLVAGQVDAALVIGTVFFLIPYNFAMYGINDVFDYASDIANPRKGGVEGALLDPSRHRPLLVGAALACVPFVIALVVIGPPLSWVALAVSLFALVAYSAPPFRFKEIPVLDSITSSVHFCSPALYGILLAGELPGPTAGTILVAFFLWGAASHAFGAVQDVVPDREGGIASIATVLGAARTVRLALALWTLAGALMLTTGWPGAGAALLVVPYLFAAGPFARVSDEESGRANRGWRRFLWINYLCGFLVTMLLIGYALTTP
ncbi:prenyltransferase [Microbacterium indicum]|uniref:prenyltransferase n=1 Tax=Microbacterium indicum TaxID=358100 RepID=UPI00055CB290|nr:prenyltransferase [Microbacterium indicum]